MGVSESKALESVARKYGVSAEEAKKSVTAVQEALSSNGWFGTPESEIRRASDWRGEAR
jgi:2-hydroxychromene-2-carboxylate isomerase